MGLVARKHFSKKFYATVFTGTEPPVSCLIDGVQFSSCCTWGKGNLAVKGGGKPVARFYDGLRSLEMAPTETVQRKIDMVASYESGERLSLELYQMDDHELLQIREGGKEETDRIVKL